MQSYVEQIVVKLRTLQLKTLVAALSNLKITVSALSVLFLLTFFGTLYQVEYGLYAAQQRYFYSWFFLAFYVLPVPGAKTVLTVLTINLLAASITRYRWEWRKLGIFIIHYGIIFLLVASVITHYFADESYISLNESESVGASFNYYESEISLWQEIPTANDRVRKEIEAFAATAIAVGKPIVFQAANITLIPEYYHAHARPATLGEEAVASTSGLTALVYAKPPLEREQILPGGLFRVTAPLVEKTQNNGDFARTPTLVEKKILLWEADPRAYELETANGTYYLRLQRKRYPLPFIVKLNDFIKEDYYGTTQAKNFESQLTLIRNDTEQESRIYMNNPLRTDNYTFFQASFAQDNQGNERSVLAVVYNRGYWVPYVASIMIVTGLIVHFLMMFVRHVHFPKQRRRQA